MANDRKRRFENYGALIEYTHFTPNAVVRLDPKVANQPENKSIFRRLRERCGDDFLVVFKVETKKNPPPGEHPQMVSVADRDGNLVPVPGHFLTFP